MEFKHTRKYGMHRKAEQVLYSIRTLHTVGTGQEGFDLTVVSRSRLEKYSRTVAPELKWINKYPCNNKVKGNLLWLVAPVCTIVESPNRGNQLRSNDA